MILFLILMLLRVAVCLKAQTPASVSLVIIFSIFGAHWCMNTSLEQEH